MAFRGEEVLLTHPIDRVVRVEQQVEVLARLRQEERLLHNQFHQLHNSFTKKLYRLQEGKNNFFNETA